MGLVTEADWMCTTCGATIVDPEPRRPCLQCGSESRTKSIRIHSTVAVRSDLSSAIDYKFPRPWDEVWYDLGRHLDLLRQCYSHIQPPNVSPRDVIDKYFGICHRLVDALRHNTETATHGSDARNHLRQDASLKLAAAYDNTHKHNDRDRPKDMRARIARLSNGSSGSSATIEYWSSIDPVETIDALDLAERCHEAWRTFLADRNLL